MVPLPKTTCFQKYFFAKKLCSNSDRTCRRWIGFSWYPRVWPWPCAWSGFEPPNLRLHRARAPNLTKELWITFRGFNAVYFMKNRIEPLCGSVVSVLTFNPDSLSLNPLKSTEFFTKQWEKNENKRKGWHMHRCLIGTYLAILSSEQNFEQ